MTNRDTIPTDLDPALVRRFALSGPRYTSYPTADRFDAAYDATVHRACLARRGTDAARPLAAYVHVPFCRSLCYYCACNKVVTRDRRRGVQYVERLLCEVAMVRDATGARLPLAALHFGGGTPTFLEDAEIERIVGALREAFAFAPAIEASIEIDPRTVDGRRVARLAALGFNRMSIGVQDFDPIVQEAVHRVQPAELTLGVMGAAREHGFRSINLDLIYGLPRQTLASFTNTLERVIDADPDRIALYNYAHLPSRFKPQRRIDPNECPDADVRVAIFLRALSMLTRAGYVYIGLDHFARPTDPLARALREGGLQRDFQGYSTGAELDLIGFGVSAISRIGDTYAQNVRTPAEYDDALDAGRLPVMRGLVLSPDDVLRREVIAEIMCRGELDPAGVGARHGVAFERYFAAEMGTLGNLVEAGLVRHDAGRIVVTPAGRLLVRAVAMVFDRYLQQSVPTGSATRGAVASYSSVV